MCFNTFCIDSKLLFYNFNCLFTIVINLDKINAFRKPAYIYSLNHLINSTV